MPRFKKVIYRLWELILVFIASFILFMFFLFPSAPNWVNEILWIVFGYLLSNVLNYIISEIKPTILEIEKVSELPFIGKDLSEMRISLGRMKSKLDKLLKQSQKMNGKKDFIR